MEPTSGEVDVFGYNLLKERKEVRGILGYLPQDFRFFAKYKTYEFLDYAARLAGMTNGRRRRQAVDEMLESVGLFDVRERYANRLSGGMKRRLGIAQALIHNPKLIIVDEPTTGLGRRSGFASATCWPRLASKMSPSSCQRISWVIYPARVTAWP